MAVKIQLRRDTAADWTAANTVLALGEPGVETDTLKLKVGDGTTAWTSLAYSISYNFNDLNSKPTTKTSMKQNPRGPTFFLIASFWIIIIVSNLMAIFVLQLNQCTYGISYRTGHHG